MCPIVVSTVRAIRVAARPGAHRADQVDEALHLRARAACQPALRAAFPKACPERCPLASFRPCFGRRRTEERFRRRPLHRRLAGRLLDAARSDAPRRRVDDPPQADVVVRVDDDLQVGQSVLDLLALVEPDVADDVVRDLGSAQRVLDQSRLRVRAVEHCRLPRRLGLGGDDVRDLDRLVVVRDGAQVFDGGPGGPSRPEGLVGPVAVEADQ